MEQINRITKNNLAFQAALHGIKLPTANLTDVESETIVSDEERAAMDAAMDKRIAQMTGKK